MRPEAYDRLCAYTLSLGDPEFVHQHVVDAQAAQSAVEGSKPIGIAFALVGLYLHLEKGWTGRQVQRAHMRLARSKHPWPTFTLPVDRGATTAADALAAPPGPERNVAVDAWCASVWAAFRDSHDAVAALIRERLGDWHPGKG